MKKFITSLAISVIPAITFAAGAQTNGAGNMVKEYFGNETITLTAQEKEAIAISKKWQATSESAIKPVAGPDGSVRFPFGISQPSIVCAVIQACDIELQPGEQINNLNIGDTVRWILDAAVSGSGATQTQHLIITPLDVGLNTTVVATTDRRTYRIKLRSHATDYMAAVTFSYPEDAMRKFDLLKNRESKERQENTIPETGELLGDLHFDYAVSGDAAWKPVRVYNNGKKTTIQMPRAMSQTDAPTLLVLRKDGGVFSDEETVMVNYRIKGELRDRFEVDSIFDRAILISGVGSNQERVTITRGK